MSDLEAAATPVQPFRVLPAVLPETEPFWRGGAENELRFWRCDHCGYLIHPPSPRCPRCLSKDLTVSAVSGRAEVFAFTVNHQLWYPTLDPPYVVAIVVLEEQDDLRLTTNIVGCDVDDVFIGMPVEVCFERYGDVWLPFFAPVASSGEPTVAEGASGGRSATRSAPE